ncbi:hypothetical protein JCM19302_1005 [Jejuia pallidilutea]|uniref:Uncharacterized protein n=1 Tax=Jejuia pallidilutea TaxID=504487 RepID=A0A090W513_9FLAO|nr:hypothetical protein JCM19302_1005 [Jejuia pallidilutea]
MSCSKDSDAILEALEEENPIEEEVYYEDTNLYSVVNDTVKVFSGEIKELYVLENDSLFDSTDIRITAISAPEFGDIRIKNDATLEYTAPETFKKTTETLAYSIEATKTNGEVFTGEAKVIIVVEGKNYMFTYQAKNQLRERFTNGYILGPGFSDDIDKVKEFTSRFLSNPSEYRPKFGESGNLPPRGQYLHTSAIYAYVMDDVTLANAIANEIIETVKNNSLNTAFWNNSNVLRWDTENALWIQTSKIKKLLDSYYFVKYLQTSLTNEDVSTIESWFNRFSDLAYRALKDRLEIYLGNNWDTKGESKFIHNGLYPSLGSTSTANPVQDANGNDLKQFTMSWAQDIYNNRQWEYVAYIHSVAVKNNDWERENWARQFVKSFIKYAVFADGTMAELWRNRDDDPTVVCSIVM